MPTMRFNSSSQAYRATFLQRWICETFQNQVLDRSFVKDESNKTFNLLYSLITNL